MTSNSLYGSLQKSILASTRVACAILFLGVPLASFATTISIINLDGANEGFNDGSAPFSGQTGNSGTTLGQQRLKVFQAAADYWERKIKSSVTIRVGAQMNPLSCNSSSAVLGAAGPESVHGNFTNAPLSNTWYVAAVANSLSGSDRDTSQNDVSATFNSLIDNNNGCLNQTNWWLGIGSSAPSGTISLYDTVLHEIGHGIGVVSLVNAAGAKFGGFNDAFSYHLYDVSQARFWRNMSNSQRVASSVNTNRLVWRGPNVVANSGHISSGKTSGYVRMYAPNPYEGGSSVSHWDTSLSPDELMEPSATPTSDDRATVQMLKDVGWELASGSNVAPILSILLLD